MHSLRCFGLDLWLYGGPPVRFFGMPMPTRMVVIRLTDGSLWIDSPIGDPHEHARQLDVLGPVAHLVSPTPMHDWRLRTWTNVFPQARVWTSSMLTGPSPPDWCLDIEQARFEGSVLLSETEFYHRRSGTLLMGDFFQNFRAEPQQRMRNAFLSLGGVLNGGMPRDLRATFAGKERRRLGRASVERLLAWDFDKIVVAHGECVESDAKVVLEQSFRWL